MPNIERSQDHAENMEKIKKEYITSGQKIIVLSVLLVIVAFVSLFLDNPFARYKEARFIVPEYLEMHLGLSSPVRSGVDEPLIMIPVFAGAGCNKVSDFKTQSVYNETELAITIEGYMLQEARGVDSCPAIASEEKATFPMLDWLHAGETKSITLTLQGKKNIYAISRTENAMYLEPKKVVNVISKPLPWSLVVGQNIDKKTPVSIGFILDGTRLGLLKITGEHSSRTDFNAKLDQFALSRGFLPAEASFRGFPQQGNDYLYVVVNDSTVIEADPQPIGTLIYGEGDAEVAYEVTLERPFPSVTSYVFK